MIRWTDSEGRNYKRADAFKNRRFAEMLCWDWEKHGALTKVIKYARNSQTWYGVFIHPQEA